MHLAADPEDYHGDAAVNYALTQAFGLDMRLFPDVYRGAELIVDALLGTGIKGGIEGVPGGNNQRDER